MPYTFLFPPPGLVNRRLTVERFLITQEVERLYRRGIILAYFDNFISLIMILFEVLTRSADNDICNFCVFFVRAKY